MTSQSKNDKQSRRILVGTEGTPDGDAAVAWAADEAALRGHELMICHVSSPIAADFWVTTDTIRKELAELCEPLLEHAVQVARERQPDVEVHAKVLVGSPSRIMLNLAESAELTVLGRSGQGGLAPRWIGSVIERMFALSPTPTVGVSAHPERTSDEVRRVVIGISADMPSESALDFAFDFAALHKAPVQVLHVIPADVPNSRHGEMQDEANERLAKLLAARELNFPDAHLVSLQGNGTTGEVLAHACASDDLLVLGRRDHAARIPGRIGRTISHALHSARCPIVVVP